MPAKRGFWMVLAVFAMQLTLSGKSLAQDPTKVAPTHYKLDFENEHVQVVSVHYGAHEKSALHEHPGGVVVVITGGHLKFTDDKGKVTDVFAKPGEARWFNPFKHTVENVGDSAYNAVYIGIRSKTNTITKNDGELLTSDQLQALLTENAR
jgi:quercetin dioxygenase-like cupin family protein